MAVPIFCVTGLSPRAARLVGVSLVGLCLLLILKLKQKKISGQLAPMIQKFESDDSVQVLGLTGEGESHPGDGDSKASGSSRSTPSHVHRPVNDA